MIPDTNTETDVKKRLFGAAGSMTGQTDSFEERVRKAKIDGFQPDEILIICTTTEEVDFQPKNHVLTFFEEHAKTFPKSEFHLECAGSCPICSLVFDETKPPKII